MAYWESDPLIYAIDASGALVHVDSVANGATCGCTCPSCHQPLVAKNGGDLLVHHFAHKQGGCQRAAETAVVMLVHQILLDEGRMHVEPAGYMDFCDDCWRIYHPGGWLNLQSVERLDADERQVSGLCLTCTDEEGAESQFTFVVVLAKPMVESVLDVYRGRGEKVLGLDLRQAYSGMRDAEGRHFSRGEFFMSVQDPDYLREVLLRGEDADDAIWDAGALAIPTNVMRWLVHPACEEGERNAHERWRRKINEQVMAAMREEERRREQYRREAEQARAEEARRRERDREEAIEAERRAFEDEGVEALLKVRYGSNYYIDDCPLWGRADVVADCGANVNSPNKCIFFEGQRYYTIGCTAWQNGVGLE